jgi:thiol-disulfide isomerase/thioredoxin
MHFTTFILLITFLISLTLPILHANEVRDLTPEEFTSVVFSKPSLVKFYAPWCKHCQALAPIYENAAASIHAKHPGIQLVAVNCVDHSALCESFNVRGYPTLHYIRPAESNAELQRIAQEDSAAFIKLPRFVFPYAGPREASEFEAFVVDSSRWGSAAKTPFPLSVDPSTIQISTYSHAENNARVAVERDEIAAGRLSATPSSDGSWVKTFRFILISVGVMIMGGAVYLAYLGLKSREISSKSM